MTESVRQTDPHGVNAAWSVAIFTARESIDTLTRCIRSALNACSEVRVVLDVLVNGNRALADQAAALANRLAMNHGNVSLRIWHIALADKAHAWNEYIYRIGPSGDLVFFIDGYVEIKADALSLIRSSLDEEPGALAASGVPTVGRSAHAFRSEILTHGGIHGNLFALRGSTVATLVQRGFRLPVGLYRNDSLLGAVLCFGLDPTRHRWNSRRILVQAEATWHSPSVAWWSPSGLRAHFKRRLRQAQGVLENAAVREHLSIRKRSPETLPRSAAGLVQDWMAANLQQACILLLKHPFCAYAALKLLRQERTSASISAPLMLTSTE